MFTQLWTVKMSDWERGLVIAILTTPLTIIYDTFTTTPMVLTLDWNKIVGTAIAGGIAYIGKNFITGQQGKMLSNK